MMPSQRARGAESRARNKLSNGPRRAQGKAVAEYSATCGHTSVAGSMLVLRQAHGIVAVKQGGTADRFYSSLAEVLFCQGRFCFSGPGTENGGQQFFQTGGHHDVLIDKTMAGLQETPI